MIVVFVHLDEHFSGLFSPKSGYLAVDLFFLLSGFVIANAYDQRFDAGWKVIEFARVRLIRLYPLYLLALLIGATKLLVQLHVGVSPPPVSDEPHNHRTGIRPAISDQFTCVVAVL